MSLRRAQPLARRIFQFQPLNSTPSSILQTNGLFRTHQLTVPPTTIRRAFSARTPIQNYLLSPNRIRIKAPSGTPWNPRRQSPEFRRFFNSSRPSRGSEQSASLSQRLKTLSREYGWSALWIYLFLSALDFPICFAAVRFLGTETIGHYEHVVVEYVKSAVEPLWPGAVSKPLDKEQEEEKEGKVELARVTQEEKKNGDASLWTQIVVAYAIHKSLIFIRVPLTAAITPKAVKVLRQWGWDIVKGKPKGR